MRAIPRDPQHLFQRRDALGHQALAVLAQRHVAVGAGGGLQFALGGAVVDQAAEHAAFTQALDAALAATHRPMATDPR